MSLSQTSSNIVVAWYIIGSIVGTGGLIALAVLLHRIHARLDKLEQALIPTLERADNLISQAEHRITDVGDSANRILAKTETTAANVETASRSTANLVRKAIHYPLVEINAVAYGFLAAVTNMVRGESKTNERNTQ